MIFYFFLSSIKFQCFFLQFLYPDSGIVFEDIVTYMCLPGYDMIGDQTLTCLANGKWIDPVAGIIFHFMKCFQNQRQYINQAVNLLLLHRFR